MATLPARLSSLASFANLSSSYSARSERRLRYAVAGACALVLLLCLSPQAFSQSCTGLCLQQTTCPGSETTSISGTVYAPNGTDPLPNVVVYVPNGGPAPNYGVTPFTPGVACYPTGEPLSGSPLVSTTTNTNGTFTLNNMPVGTNIPLVIQTGRWRRFVTISTVAACTNTPVAAAQTNFPSTQAEFSQFDNIPLIAISTGSVDAAECVLRKMGIADSQFSNPAQQGGSGRIRLYLGEGSPGAKYSLLTPSATQLWSGANPDVDTYDLVMFPCQGTEYDKTAAEQASIINYASAGGRIFATHYSYVWLINPTPDTVANPFASTVNWSPKGVNPTPDPQTGFINTSFPKGEQLAQWLKVVDPTSTLGQIQINTLRNDQTGVVAPTQSWLTLADAEVMQLTFNTPVGSPPANQCGRVLFNEYHVFNVSDAGQTFPNECTSGPITAQEQLLEFSLFDLSTFVSPDIPPTDTVGITNTPTAFVQGDAADTIAINVTNTSTTSPNNPSLTLTAVLPASLTATAMAGTNPGTTGWLCTYNTLTCTRNTGLTANTSDPITLTVSVASNAPVGTGAATVSATASGGGLASSVTGTDAVTIMGTTALAVGVSPSSEDYGNDAQVTITAVLSWAGSGVAPTASDVTISGNAPSNTYGTTSCGGPSGNTITCTNTYTPTALDVPNSYTMAAAFSGDSRYIGTSNTNSFTIAPATTTTAVTSGSNPSTYGQSLTLTATINGEFGLVKGHNGALAGRTSVGRAPAGRALSGRTLPRAGLTQGEAQPQDVAGSVTWSLNTGCGTTPVTSGNPGVATCITSSLPGGTDTITATYSGDSNHNGSSGTLANGQQVNPAATSIAVTNVSPAAEDYGQDQQVTITAVLSWTGGTAAPTASAVTISGTAPSSTYGTTSCGAPISNTITCTNTYTPTGADTPGLYTMSATFAGDNNYSTSSSPQSNNFAIAQATSSTSVASNLNPSVFGQSVTFTATISDEYGLVKGRSGASASRALTQKTLAQKRGAHPQVPGEAVLWSADTGCGTTLATGNPLTATCTTSSLPEGTDTISATYSGDSDHDGSSGTLAGGQQVNQAATSIAVTTVSPAAEDYGQDAASTITAVLSWFGSGAAPTASDVSITTNAPGGALGATSCGTPVASNSVIATVPVGTRPTGIAYDPSNGNVYVADGTAASVSVIQGSTNSVLATVPVGVGPRAITFDPSNGDLYVANRVDNTVSVIDGSSNTVVATVPVGSEPFAIALDPNNGDLYVANQNDGTVSVIDGSTNSVVATVPVGSLPIAIGFDPNNGNVYVANSGATSTVSVIDGSTNTVVATITVAVGPASMAFDPNNGDVYVAGDSGPGYDQVSVINGSTNAVVATLTVPAGSSAVAFDANNGNVYVANFGYFTHPNGSVSVISGSSNTVVTTIPVGDGAIGISIDPSNGDLYVTNSGDGTVSVIDGSSNTVIATVPVGAGPYAIAFNQSNGDMYVVNESGGTVSVINPSATMTCSSAFTPDATTLTGTYTMSASFSGDSNYSASSSPQTNNFSITDATSTTSVTSNLNPSLFGQSVTLTATINGEYGLVKGRNGALGRGKLTNKKGPHSQDVSGTVAWSANTGCGTTPVTTGNPGVATCITTALPVGTDTITATYSGDGDHSGSSGTLAGGQVVNPGTVNVTVGTSPAGLAFSVDGTPYTSAQSLTWTIGSGHTIATSTPQAPNLGTQYTFANWSDGGSLSHLVTASTGTTSYTANFNTSYLLTTAANPTNGGTVTPASGSYYAANTKVNLTATPNAGYAFSDWTGHVAKANSAATTVTMSAPQSVTANFVVAEVVVTPTSVNYGTVYLGNHLKKEVTVENFTPNEVNIGPVTLTVTKGDASQFQLDHDCPVKLFAGKSCLISVIFTPDAPGPDAATLNIPTSVTPTFEVPITAQGRKK